MSRIPVLPAIVGAIVVGNSLVAAPRMCQAQILRGIRDRVTQAAGQAAVQKAVGRDTTPAAKPAATAAVRETIDGPRVDQFIVAMRPLLDAAQRKRDFESWKERYKKYASCSAQVRMKPAPASSRATDAEMERLNAISSSITDRLLAASQRRDTLAQKQLTDSSLILTDKQMVLMYPAIRTQCGAYVPRPVEPNRASLDSAGALAVKASGTNPTSLGRMRERIAMYLLSPAQSDLDASERAAVDARRKDLEPLVALFQNGSVLWKTWSDLYRGWSGS